MYKISLHLYLINLNTPNFLFILNVALIYNTDTHKKVVCEVNCKSAESRSDTHLAHTPLKN